MIQWKASLVALAIGLLLMTVHDFNRDSWKRIIVRSSLIAALALLLTACATTSSRDRALIAAGQAAATLPTMADAELTCADEPRVPTVKKGSTRIRESQVTDYVLDVREAGADCRDKLGVVRRVWRKVEEVKSRAVPPTTKGETR